MWIKWTYADCEVPALKRVFSKGDTAEVSDIIGNDLVAQKRAKEIPPPSVKSEEPEAKSTAKSGLTDSLIA